MRAILQRVTKGKVTVENHITGEISAGLVVLLGVGANDTEAEVELLTGKIANLRIFTDAEGKFNLSALDVKAEMLVVSQFTLFADCRKGRRPSFTGAARPELAVPLYEKFVERLRAMDFKVENRRLSGRYAGRNSQHGAGDDLAGHGRSFAGKVTLTFRSVRQLRQRFAPSRRDCLRWPGGRSRRVAGRGFD